MVAALVFLAFHGVFVYKTIQNRHKALIILPVYTVLSLALTLLFPLGIRGAHNYMTTIVILFFVLYYARFNKRVLTWNTWFIPFALYLLTLVLFSSDKLVSLMAAISLLVGFPMIPIGYYYINSQKKLALLNKSVLWLMIIFAANFALSNYFNFGDDPYLTGTYGGSLTRANSIFASVCILLLPLTFKHAKRKAIYVIFSAVCAAIIIVSLNRTPIITLVFGYTVYLFVSTLISKNRLNWIIYPALLIFLLIMSQAAILRYSDRLAYTLEEGTYVQDFEDIGRTQEIVFTFKEMIMFESIEKSLFGQEVFNKSATAGTYAFGLLDADRVIHTTAGNIFHGTGIVGTVLFVLTLVSVYGRFKRVKKNVIINRNNYYLFALLWALFLISLFNLYTSTFFVKGFTVVTFLYIGALIKQIANSQTSKTGQATDNNVLASP